MEHWLDEARATPGFAAFWDEGPAGTRAYVLACVALADLGARAPADRAQLYTELITEPRATVVDRLSHGEVPGDAVKTLERCDASRFQLADWAALFALFGDAKWRTASAGSSIGRCADSRRTSRGSANRARPSNSRRSRGAGYSARASWK